MVDASLSHKIIPIRHDPDLQEIERAVCHATSTNDVKKPFEYLLFSSSSQCTLPEEIQQNSSTSYFSKEQSPAFQSPPSLLDRPNHYSVSHEC